MDGAAQWKRPERFSLYLSCRCKSSIAQSGLKQSRKSIRNIGFRSRLTSSDGSDQGRLLHRETYDETKVRGVLTPSLCLFPNQADNKSLMNDFPSRVSVSLWSLCTLSGTTNKSPLGCMAVSQLITFRDSIFKQCPLV